MATTIQSTSAHRAHSTTQASAYERFMEKIKFSYFGIISMTILIGSCLGGITAMFVMKNDAAMWQLGLCMAVAMTNNVAAISQAPVKWVVNSFLISVVVNVLLILVNL